MGKSPNSPGKSAGQGSGSNERPNSDNNKTGGSSSKQEPESSRPGNAGETDVGGSSTTLPRPQVVSDAAVGGGSRDVRPGGSRDEGPRRKRTRTEDTGAGSGSSKTKFDGPENVTPCSVCGKTFASWKALFGHMRSHPERQWRGVYPPPTFNRDRDGSPEQAQGENAKEAEQELASCLLNLAKGCLEKLGKSTDQPSTQSDNAGAENESGPSGSKMEALSSQVQDPSSSSSSQRMGLDIDLNAPQEPSHSSPPPPPQMVEGSSFDLNMPAPADSDEEAAS